MMFFLGKKFTIFLSILFLLATSLLFNRFVYAQEATPTPAPTSQLSGLQNKINELTGKISELQGEAKTLSSQIQIMDSQIKLTEARIAANKQNIMDLTLDIDTATKKISSLEGSLDSVTEVLINRIVATYAAGRVQPLEIILSSRDASNFMARLNYLRIAQAHDKKLIYEIQQAKNDYTNQKEILEGKKKKIELLHKQLESYTAQLDQEKAGKQRLLNETKGSEANYQELLANARAEYEAIQGIVSGKGTETEIGLVNQGDTIATLITGASCNSTGTHLHFTVGRDGTTENPFNYLKSVDHSNESGGDEFKPSGSWEWPISPPIDLNQGYGDTWYVRTYHAYPFHNGLDIDNDGGSSPVKAVRNGTLFQGSYSGNGGCRLRYVRVHHSDDGLDTF